MDLRAAGAVDGRIDPAAIASNEKTAFNVQPACSQMRSHANTLAPITSEPFVNRYNTAQGLAEKFRLEVVGTKSFTLASKRWFDTRIEFGRGEHDREQGVDDEHRC